MDIRILETSLTILIGAILLDFLFGDPRPYININAIIRKVATSLDPYFRVFRHKMISGFLYDIFVLSVILVPVFALLFILKFFAVAYIITAIVVFKSTFSLSRIRDDVNPVIEALESENLEEARVLAGKYVHRDLSRLEYPLISSAVIEKICEDLVNYVISPFFYFSFLGILGAIGAKVFIVLDSLVGQRNRRNFEFGKPTAIIHSIINYIPSRIAGVLMVIGSEFMDYRVLSKPFKSIRMATDSVTIGWPAGAFASSLNLRLERPGMFIMNEGGFLPSSRDVRRMLRLFYMVFYLMTIIITIPIMIGIHFIP
ncbi:MAG: cobalamin biosynthesis protein [Thermoplasmataceae archaeon]